MRNSIFFVFLTSLLAFHACDNKQEEASTSIQPVYQDIPYLQDYAVKFTIADENLELKKVFSDRNDIIQVLTTKGLFDFILDEITFVKKLSFLITTFSNEFCITTSLEFR